MIRSEQVFKDCKDYIFEHYDSAVESLQAFIGDDVEMDVFAEKAIHGLVLFNREEYPVLVVEPSGFELVTTQTPTVVLQYADLLVQVKVGTEQGDLAMIKAQRYADALVKLIDEDITFGGAATLVSLVGKVAFGSGREGDQEYSMFLAKLSFRK